MIRFISVLTILIVSLSISTAQQALWMRYPAISPDGSMIAFAFQGDLWVVSAKGGKADRITSNDAYDVSPVWSPKTRRRSAPVRQSRQPWRPGRPMGSGHSPAPS